MKNLLRLQILLVLVAIALIGGADRLCSYEPEYQAHYIPAQALTIPYYPDNQTSQFDTPLAGNISYANILRTNGSSKRPYTQVRTYPGGSKFSKLCVARLGSSLQQNMLPVCYPFITHAHRLIRLGKLII